MENAAAVEKPASNVVRPSFKSRQWESRGAPEERLQRLVDDLKRDGRKLRAIEILMTVRSAQVVTVDTPLCGKLVSVAADLDRVMQRVQRAGYRQLDHELITASRKAEDDMTRAVADLTEQAAVLATLASFDPEFLLDPLVRRRIKELSAAKREAGGPPPAPEVDADSERPRRRTKA